MNTEIKYLYIDDRKDSQNAILSLREEGKLVIDIIQPPQRIKDAISILKKKKYDGLIVDQQLDEKKLDNGEKNTYLGGALAMDIRANEYHTIQKGKDKKDTSIPIVLYSANTNLPLMLYGYGDSIYDLILTIKTTNSFKEFRKLIPMYQKQLESLVKGYTILKNKSSIESLSCPDENNIDSRFVDELKRRDSLTVHTKASFILNELIIKQGILIDEDILAVRLGIDKNKSKDNWNKVLDSLKEYRADYQGVFSEGWPRWWMPMVKNWWYQKIDSDTYIRFYDAKQRVELISEKLNIKEGLIPAKAESKYSVHNDYWTVCDFSKEPLDIEDGLMLAGQEDLYPWQDAKYVSIHSALVAPIEIAESDKEVLENFNK
ncbi:MAG: hypothetical protein J6Y24_09880 [Bacteroidales bacterium]|nr:hypothetical protein [Bacteroidales bacterium]